jgi:transposase InsO family protein
MPWKESQPMDLRVNLITDYQEGESIAALSQIYGVSRKTIYKWLDRHEQQGVAGLADLSRAPHNHPHQVSAEIAAQIVEARQRWKWGPRKLRIKLQQSDPKIVWPAASTIADILRQRGLTHKQRKRHTTPPSQTHTIHASSANQTWCADFKGWFHTQDGSRCDPLTITDAHSRFLLRCHITPKTDTAHVESIFDGAFHEYGLPQCIHTDNGPPFASTAPGGLSRLSIRWMKLGIGVERSRPGKPQDNGRHERLHLTLLQEALQHPAATPRRQQVEFDRFQQIYNEERPHEALDYQTPASVYVLSPKPMPRRVPEIEYASDMPLRRISSKGDLNWKHQKVFVTEALRGEVIGLRAHDERYCELFFGPVPLGWLDTHTTRFLRKLPLSARR